MKQSCVLGGAGKHFCGLNPVRNMVVYGHLIAGILNSTNCVAINGPSGDKCASPQLAIVLMTVLHQTRSTEQRTTVNGGKFTPETRRVVEKTFS